MSLEDVKSTTSLGAESSASDHCNGHCLNQNQDQGVNQSDGQDGIVLDRIASLSVDKFDPSDFTGRFSKIQLRSKKRRGIINRGMWRLALKILCVFCFLLLKSTNANEHKRQWDTCFVIFPGSLNVIAYLSWPEELSLRVEMAERQVEHPAEKMILRSPAGMWVCAVFNRFEIWNGSDLLLPV